MKNITGMYVMQSRTFAPDVVPYRLIITPFGTNFLRQNLGFREASWNQDSWDFVFQDGALEHNGTMLPITWLGFNEQRIVIQVQGDSDAAHAAYAVVSAALTRLAHGFRGAVPVLFTEETSCAARLNFEWTALLNPELVEQVVKKTEELSMKGRKVAIKGVSIRFTLGAVTTEEKLSEYGITLLDQTLAIEPKVGVPLSEQVYFTYSPCDSDSHLKLVAGLESSLAKKSSRSVRKPASG